LLLGNDDNLLTVVDMRTFSVATRLKHTNTNLLSATASSATTQSKNTASVSASAYKGITVLNALEDPYYYENYANNYAHDFVIFSGCSSGFVKVWNLPDLTYHYHSHDRHDDADVGEDESGESDIRHLEETEHVDDHEGKKENGVKPSSSTISSIFSSASGVARRNSKTTGLSWLTGSTSSSTSIPLLDSRNNKVRLKQSSILTMKTHSSMITSLISQPHPDHSNGWIYASGDCHGNIAIVKSNDGSTAATTVGINIKSTPSNNSTSPPSLNSSASGRNSKIHSVVSSPSKFQSASNVINDYTISAMSFFNVNATASSSYSHSFTLPSYVVVGNYLGIINIIDINYGVSIYQSQGHLLKINKIVGMKHQQFLTCSNDRNILLWDIRMRNPSTLSKPVGTDVAPPHRAGASVDPLYPFNVEERCLGYSMIGNHLPHSPVASAAHSHRFSHRHHNHLHHQHQHQHLHQQSHPNGSQYGSSTSGGTPLFYSSHHHAYQQQQLAYYQSLSYKKSSYSPITDVAVGGLDSSVVISTSADGIIKLWDLRSNLVTPYHTIMNGHYPNRITSLLWEDQSLKYRHQSSRSDDYANFFYTAGYDGCVRSWDVITGNNHQSFHIDSAPSATGPGRALSPPEKIVQMIKPSFFYEDNPVSEVRAPEVTGNLNNRNRLYRNCLVTKNWMGSIQLFVNKSTSDTDATAQHDDPAASSVLNKFTTNSRYQNGV
jgi:WD40 repeat protein